MNKIVIIFFSFIILFSSAMSVENENEKFKFIKDIYSESWALIIGINDYQNVDPLSYAVKDAISINNILIEKYGFNEKNVMLITNKAATKDNIMNGFQQILLEAGPKDRIVVFYAGHGATYPLPNGGDMGYLIPVDGEASKEKIFLTSIAMETIEQLADMSAAKHILYLVDACYGGLTLNTRGLGRDQTPEYLRKMTKEKGRQVITAGGKDEKVMEKAEWGHSAFTKNLLQGLENELADANYDGIISAEELGIFIRDGVIIDTESQHTPQKGRLGSDLGEFVFISETLVEKVASADDGLDDIENQLAKQQKQMAELAEMFSKRQGQRTDDIIPSGKPKKSKSKRNKSRSNPNMKIASTLSWVFPGMGHYYKKQIGKGIMFTGLELVSIGALGSLSNQHSILDEEYQLVQANMNGVEDGTSDCGDLNPEDCYQSWKSEATRLIEEKNSKTIGMIISGTAAVGVWIWNTRDVKKFRSAYSHESRFSLGVNSRGQVEVRIKF